MNRSHTKYLLIGGGLSAASATAAIRHSDPLGKILMIARENTRPYRRKDLPSLITQAHPDRQSLYVHPAGWYDQHHVALRTGRQVEAIDPGRNCVILDNGEQISYERLLIATGASPNRLNIPGADLPSVLMLRTLDDADRLANSLRQAQAEGRPHPRGRGRVTILGAGMLGMDVAGRLVQMNLHVDLVEIGAHPWPSMAGEGIGRFATRRLQDIGVAFHPQRQAIRLEGDGRVQQVIIGAAPGISAIEATRWETDLVLVAMGVSPVKDIVRHTAIAAERAILTDEHCRTNLPDIYAAGDCAAVFDPLFGRHRLPESWDTAEETGKIAGLNMAGGTAAWNNVTHFQSHVLGMTLEAWGDHRPVSHRLYRAPNNGPESAQIEFGIASDGRLAQVMALGSLDQAQRNILESMVHQRLQTRGIEEELKDPAADLTKLISHE